MINVLKDLLLIEVDKTPVKIGSFFIPETARKNQDTGIVRGIGDEVKIEIEEGDTVLFNPYAGFRVYDEERDSHLLCIKAEDVIAKLEEGEMNV